MRVEQLGSGTPEVAILAGVHGDEPCGVRAVERLLEAEPSVSRPVKLVVANERALSRETRYVDEDLNRTFPGDPNAESHEKRLAAELERELSGVLTFSMHSTRSYGEPFAIVNRITERTRKLCSQLPVGSLVGCGEFDEGRMFTRVEAIEVECGLQGSDRAAENAYRLARAFLRAVDALPGETDSRELPAYRLVDCIPKERADSYEVYVENFKRVDPGDPFAAADGTARVADEPFYPVLMSPDGYQDVFGYAAERIDEVAKTN